MKKVTITFPVNDREEEELVIRALKSEAMHEALVQIQERIFRPARKHGYNDPLLTKLFDNGANDKDELIGALEEHFLAILDNLAIRLHPSATSGDNFQDRDCEGFHER